MRREAPHSPVNFFRFPWKAELNRKAFRQESVECINQKLRLSHGTKLCGLDSAIYFVSQLARSLLTDGVGRSHEISDKPVPERETIKKGVLNYFSTPYLETN